MRPRKALLSTPIALLVAAIPSLASASVPFPGSMQAELELSYAPTCTVCHNTPAGGLGTVTQPFGTALRANGLTAGSVQSLADALTKLETDGIDSDCDDVPDIDQLKDGRDPNTGAAIDGSDRPAPENAGCGGEPLETPAFGCGAQIAGAPLPAGAGAATALLLGLLVLRRRRAA